MQEGMFYIFYKKVLNFLFAINHNNVKRKRIASELGLLCSKYNEIV